MKTSYKVMLITGGVLLCLECCSFNPVTDESGTSAKTIKTESSQVLETEKPKATAKSTTPTPVQQQTPKPYITNQTGAELFSNTKASAVKTTPAFQKHNTPNSSCFSEIGYNETTETLFVRFRSTGDAYTYADFSKEEYEAFSGADSLGTYYANYIKGKYVSTKQDSVTSNSSSSGSNRTYTCDSDYYDDAVEEIMDGYIEDYYLYLRENGEYDENEDYYDEAREWFEEQISEGNYEY